MSTKTVRGTYGSGNTPCDVYVYETRNGNWFVIDGSVNVGCTVHEVNDGVDCETVPEYDFFTWNDPITSEGELAAAVEA